MSEMVSINIATRNRAHLLERCFKSIFNQTYTNYEIVIVDDGSSDNTEHVVKEYADKCDNDIIYIKSKENIGVARARNICLKNSKGKYIAVMDDDDEWIDSDKLSKQVKILEETSNVIVCSSVNLINASGDIKQKIINKPDNIFGILLKGNGIIYSPTVLVEKSVMEAIGGYDVKLKRGVDSELYREIVYEHKKEIFFMQEITTNIHEYGNDRITSRMSSKEAVIKIKQNFYIITKHFGGFVRHPKALLFRLRNIARNIVYLIIGK